MQKTIDNLKDRSKDERQVVAGGIALTVVVVLLVAWAVLFFKRVQSGAQDINLDSGAQNEFNFTATRQAQQAIESYDGQSAEDLARLRDDAAAAQLRGDQQIYLQEIGAEPDQFGNGSDI